MLIVEKSRDKKKSEREEEEARIQELNKMKLPRMDHDIPLNSDKVRFSRHIPADASDC
jgi:hypothetical protein